MNSAEERTLELVRESGVLRPRDLNAHGIHRRHLQRLVEQGLVVRISRGLYMAEDCSITEHHSMAEASKRVPKGIICLLSALQFHELTTQNPFEIWMAIGEKDRIPKLDQPSMRFVRFSGSALAYGVQTHDIEGVDVNIYTPAKTVADCFKYRNKIGLDVALEALRDCWRQRRAAMDELWEAAEVCRVTNIMRPYLESLV
jgi:predicted transcriptional regulator of viral defense system